MNNRFLRTLQLNLGLLDFTVVNMVFFTAKFLFKQRGMIGSELEYVYFGIFLNIVWIFLVAVMNIYNEKYVMSFEPFTKVTLRLYLYYLLLVTIYLFFFRMTALSRLFIIVVLSSIPVALLINRFIYLAIYQYFKKEGLPDE